MRARPRRGSAVDDSFVEANAAKESRIPREQLVEAAQVKHRVRQYLQEQWDMLAKTTMHEWTIQISCDPHG